MREYNSFSEFWPYYLREHSRPATRGWHYVGSILALCLLFTIIVSGHWAYLPLTLVCGYVFAWLSHGFIEKNKPATFTYPLWSLASDYKMLFCFLAGQMPRELEKAGVKSPA